MRCISLQWKNFKMKNKNLRFKARSVNPQFDLFHYYLNFRDFVAFLFYFFHLQYAMICTRKSTISSQFSFMLSKKKPRKQKSSIVSWIKFGVRIFNYWIIDSVWTLLRALWNYDLIHYSIVLKIGISMHFGQ